jgi:hypothetical protein
MSGHDATSKSTGNPERLPFGDLHEKALRAMPDDGNHQRDAFMAGRPNVWWTLRRHVEGMMNNGATRAQMRQLFETARLYMDARYGAAPCTESLVDVATADISAECVERMAVVMAADEPSLGKLAKVIEAGNADIVATTKLVEVAHRDYTKARQAAAR